MFIAVLTETCDLYFSFGYRFGRATAHSHSQASNYKIEPENEPEFETHRENDIAFHIDCRPSNREVEIDETRHTNTHLQASDCVDYSFFCTRFLFPIPFKCARSSAATATIYLSGSWTINEKLVAEAIRHESPSLIKSTKEWREQQQQRIRERTE